MTKNSSIKQANSIELIFTVPADISEMDKNDAICHSLEQIKGTVLTTAHLLGSNAEYSPQAVCDCLSGVYSQLEIIEKLIKHENAL